MARRADQRPQGWTSDEIDLRLMSRRSFVLSSLAVVGGTVVACAPSGAPAATQGGTTQTGQVPPAAPKPNNVRVNLGMQPIVPAAPLFIPMDKGYYKDEGLDVQWDQAASSSDSMAQVAAGNLDVSQATITVSLLNGWDRDLNVKVVSGLTGFPPTPPMSEAILVRKQLWDSGQVKDAAGLKGRKVGVSGVGSFSQYALEKMMQSAGMTVADIELTVVQFPDHPAALANGSIDAAYAVEPFITRAIEEDIAEMLEWPASIHGAQVSILVGSDKFLADASVNQAFMRGLLRGLEDLDKNGWGSSENAPIIQKYTRMPAELMSRILPQYGDPEGAINWDSMHDQQAFFIRQGETTYKEPFDLLKFAVDGPRLAALAARKQ